MTEGPQPLDADALRERLAKLLHEEPELPKRLGKLLHEERAPVTIDLGVNRPARLGPEDRGDDLANAAQRLLGGEPSDFEYLRHRAAPDNAT